MAREIAEIPASVARLLDDGQGALDAAARALDAADPQVIVTVARGSSDHAAGFFKYACELTLGLPVASVGPSIASVYEARLKLPRAACLGISQSGQSPDIVKMMEMARAQGACTLAITNDPTAPITRAAQHTIALLAGPERSVAATKTFVTSVVAGLAVLARWSGDRALTEALEGLPEQLSQAIAVDWSALGPPLADRRDLFVLGRGLSYPLACEAALKFKETCQIDAEAYSSAELMHGPVSVVGQGFLVLALIARDATEPHIRKVCAGLLQKGARVFATTEGLSGAEALGFVPTGHPLTDPIPLIASFYGFVEAMARRLDIDPDTPRNLNKVTQTL